MCTDSNPFGTWAQGEQAGPLFKQPVAGLGCKWGVGVCVSGYHVGYRPEASARFIGCIRIFFSQPFIYYRLVRVALLSLVVGPLTNLSDSRIIFYRCAWQ